MPAGRVSGGWSPRRPSQYLGPVPPFRGVISGNVAPSFRVLLFFKPKHRELAPHCGSETEASGGPSSPGRPPRRPKALSPTFGGARAAYALNMVVGSEAAPPAGRSRPPWL